MVAVLERFDHEHLARVSRGRRDAHLSVLWDLQDSLEPAPLDAPDVAAVARFLSDRSAAGYSPGTVKKWRAMVLAFYAWAWRAGDIDGDTLLSLRAIPTPAGASPRANPNPYTPAEIRRLWATVDERWPKVDGQEAAWWFERWNRGRSPYSRIRPIAIRCQLNAIIALALHCGLRRSEIFRLDEASMHADNAYALVWDDVGPWDGECRHVPYTDSARALIAPWCDVRELIAPEHNHAWLNLWGGTTAREPMTQHTFDRYLRTYVGPGWNLRRLRDTCIVGWISAGLPREHLRQILGLSVIADLLPYAELVSDPETEMRRLDETFTQSVARATLPA